MADPSFASLVAPINLSTDLVDSVALRKTAALRYADHHLNARASSVLLPKECKNVQLFCVSQACMTYPILNLKERLQEARTCSETVIPVESEMWVESLGRTSITFGHVITFEGEILAAITRINVRKNVGTNILVEISEKERLELCLARPQRDVVMPTVTKLEVPSEPDMKALFDVRIGPQHCNNDHVDHAALADLMLQGLYVQGYPYETQKLSIRYLEPGELDQTLSVCVHKDRPLAALYKDGSDIPLVICEIEPPSRSNL